MKENRNLQTYLIERYPDKKRTCEESVLDAFELFEGVGERKKIAREMDACLAV